ncbi:biotin/lipoyl-containing protein [Propionimicrobium sp. PCR01-08-3]|uniref:biotin/lipoyl-containing protein n=1 Tax=Propionimicrobium sp. PCR01-08-3 TaxID=3052086 RepID=UPI00255CDBF8|nr:biotin/lipoyl-containing protein [Propionimicrobium sp. PCR01-08-3]WIY82290.1 biotin/lipoyl-containing protein [Propionimicrobium sp. PCR01-08-3]
MRLKMTVNGTEYVVDVEAEQEVRQVPAPIVIGGGPMSAPTHQTASVPGSAANAITAPLAGSVARILVKEGDKVDAGQVVIVLEAMKMETEITAPNAGTVDSILVDVREAVQGGQALVTLA